MFMLDPRPRPRHRPRPRPPSLCMFINNAQPLQSTGFSSLSSKASSLKSVIGRKVIVLIIETSDDDAREGQGGRQVNHHH